jgi:ADP-ribose pyrophosphatase
VFKVTREDITLSNGVRTNLDIIRHPGASAIVPLVDNNRLILVKQYRHAVGDYIWEIPAGTLDPGETHLQCAKRELIEETGFTAEVWEKLGEITPAPGYSDDRTYIFLASRLVHARQNLDGDEIIDVHKVRLVDVIEMIRKNMIQDGKTISGIFMASLWLKDNKDYDPSSPKDQVRGS